MKRGEQELTEQYAPSYPTDREDVLVYQPRFGSTLPHDLDRRDARDSLL